MLIRLKNEMMLGEKPKLELIPGTWIAGGSVRRWFTGEKQESDIDVFAQQEDLAQQIAKKNSWIKESETKNAFNFKKDEIRYQFIRMYSNDMEETMNKFDFHHCQFAYDGTSIVTTLEAIVSTLRKALSVNKILSGYEVDSLRRAFKYQRQGYTPCIGTIRDLALCFQNVTKEQIVTQIEISPCGGFRNVRLD